MYDGILLKHLVHIYDLDYIPIFNKYGNDDIRIYYKPTGELGSGVDIFVLESVKDYGKSWDLDTFCVRVIYKVVCYFDGLRHLYMNPNEEDSVGYLNYVDLAMHIKVYEQMQELIKKYCRDWDR